MTQVFVDMDGVLADFDSHHHRVFGRLPDRVADNVDWSHVNNHDGFFLGIDPMPDMLELWSFVERLTPKPKILTGVPSSVAIAPENKRAWVRKHIGDDVEVICCRSKDKSLHAAPGDILIDDWEKVSSHLDRPQRSLDHPHVGRKQHRPIARHGHRALALWRERDYDYDHAQNHCT